VKKAQQHRRRWRRRRRYGEGDGAISASAAAQQSRISAENIEKNKHHIENEMVAQWRLSK
jgi:hypothetical protein